MNEMEEEKKFKKKYGVPRLMTPSAPLDPSTRDSQLAQEQRERRILAQVEAWEERRARMAQ